MSTVQVYTIVDRRTQHAFAMRIQRRRAAAAFRAHADALVTAHAVESRELVMGTMSETDALLPATFPREELEHHYLKAWESYDTLVDTCRESGLDVFYCVSLESNAGQAIEFSGHLISTEEQG